ncbi:MAG: ABC transporter ATP-binding protein [Thermoplasmata archaeon]|nr:MAG: ABC transporter ATP-binding protein [Thermoplasmata archaeon]
MQSLSKSFGKVLALDGVDLDIRRGEFFGFFGPNGAGKTTLLRILTGQLEPSEGEASVMDVDLPDGAVEVRARVGVVPEFESPPSFLTGDEYLNFVCKARGIEDAAPRVDRWVEFFELGDHRHTLCKDMSKGMRQKVMLGAAFIHEPALLFLDEPFINLDPLFQRKVQSYLREYIEGGGTIFMCSHLLEIAERLCSRLAIINEGRVVRTGTLDQLMDEGETGLGEVFMRLVGRKVEDLELESPETGAVTEG